MHHVLAKDAARIEMIADKASSMRIQFPSYLPSFDNCDAGAVMCCHVADRQANDAAGLCNDGEVCSDAEPEDNTDVCVANMADSPVSSRVKRGLAVYHLNRGGDEAEGNVNCHGFAWDSAIGHKTSTEYKGNMVSGRRLGNLFSSTKEISLIFVCTSFLTVIRRGIQTKPVREGIRQEYSRISNVWLYRTDAYCYWCR